MFDVLARFEAEVTDLLALDRSMLAPNDLLELVRRLEVQTRRLAAVDLANVAELEHRHLASELRVRDTKTLLVDLLRIDPSEAKRRVDAARDLGPRISLHGEALPPIFPALAASLADGTVSMQHLSHIMKFAEQPPVGVDEPIADTAQAHLLEAARHTYPRNVGTLAVDLLARIDQDGIEPRDEVLQRRRGFDLHTAADGWSKVSGYLSPRATAAIKTVLDPLSAPDPSDAGVPDERTATQRRHDGLLAAAERLLRSGNLPDAAGAPVTVLVTIRETDLRNRSGHARTAHGDLLPIKQLVAMAGDADVLPVYLNDQGGVLAYGRGKRLATPAQRRALAARDGGCTRPGCTAPPTWCEVHHVIPWADNGPTDLDNMALVCPQHHRQLDRGWGITMRSGSPHWIAPSWIDPTRTPRRNAALHLQLRFAELDPVSSWNQ